MPGHGTPDKVRICKITGQCRSTSRFCLLRKTSSVHWPELCCPATTTVVQQGPSPEGQARINPSGRTHRPTALPWMKRLLSSLGACFSATGLGTEPSSGETILAKMLV